ncbi:hypothetical protein AU509_09055 [Lonsdalea britannica]|uniref:hypothetical protein n=1 Tax=Lonsdalea britannica TaxID=1082704 RepID=UPI000A263AEC|nr:hypothetical protein [Lonsdalea britannica]OSM97266.1 hypothetical protein AU509_09055 [Lonsdalea britannica]
MFLTDAIPSGAGFLQGKARQGKARQGKARQGKARQGKARQVDKVGERLWDWGIKKRREAAFFIR